MKPARSPSALIHRGLIALTITICFGGMAWVLSPIVAPTVEARLQQQLLTTWIDHLPLDPSTVAQLNVADPEGAWSRFFSAHLAIQNRQHDEAVRWFEQLPRDQGRWELVQQMSLARRYEVLGQLAAAEKHYRQAIALAPNQIEACSRLGHLLQIEGRTWEAIPLFFTQILRGKCRGDELLAAAGTERFFVPTPCCRDRLCRPVPLIR